MKENKLILEFLGADLSLLSNSEIMTAQYHKSWDWLMNVVDKIESIDEEIELFGGNIIKVSYSVQIENTSVTIWKHSDRFDSKRIIEVNGDSKMKATYNAVISFIKEVEFINQ